MREAGYSETRSPIGNASQQLPWFGCIPEVEKRLALLDDDQHAQRQAARNPQRKAKNAEGQLKVRGDGTRYLRFRDGRIEELDDPAVTLPDPTREITVPSTASEEPRS